MALADVREYVGDDAMGQQRAGREAESRKEWREGMSAGGGVGRDGVESMAASGVALQEKENSSRGGKIAADVPNTQSVQLLNSLQESLRTVSSQEPSVIIARLKRSHSHWPTAHNLQQKPPTALRDMAAVHAPSVGEEEEEEEEEEIGAPLQIDFVTPNNQHLLEKRTKRGGGVNALADARINEQLAAISSVIGTIDVDDEAGPGASSSARPHSSSGDDGGGRPGSPSTPPRSGDEHHSEIEPLSANVYSPRMTPERHRKSFILSALAEDAAEITAKIESLGGVVMQTDGSVNYRDPCWLTEFTHVCTKCLTRSVKVLASIAAGRWILSPHYVYESAEKGYWLNEEDYQVAHLDDDSGTSLRDGILAWQRIRVEQTNLTLAEVHRQPVERLGAFRGLRVVCLTESSFANIIWSGGGLVLTIGYAPSETMDYSDANLVVVESKQVKHVGEYLKMLKEKGLEIVLTSWVLAVLRNPNEKRKRYHPKH
eukprot:TRINITY_DN7172_c3_g1_i1.p1 TRINITY_DN7172_c3_g1~~TRINITY_DN7172_c3_g1_i1.p1  ORF type:complete len:551 (-),score=71.67 TRINITY_DN7172_c3_g1_i1:77-1531(-)